MACKCCKWLFPGKAPDQERRKLAANTFPPPQSEVEAKFIGKTAQESVSEEEKQRRREIAAEKAAARQDENLARGVGDVTKAKNMQERGQKEELLGKIEERYLKLKEDMPMGLRMASVEQLREHLKALQARGGQKGKKPEDLTEVVLES